MEKNPFLELKEQAAQSSSCPGFRVILDDEFEYETSVSQQPLQNT